MKRVLLAAAALLAALAAVHADDRRHSGFADMSPATQALQRDDAQNPAWLWVEDGRQRFAASCSRCHDAASSLRGVAARYPAWDDASRAPVTLLRRIELCRTRHAGLPAEPPDGDAAIALAAWLGQQSRGQPIAPPSDPRLVPWREQGRALYTRRIGQLALSCADCHDRAAGARLGGSVIPQAHPTGYPIYRLEWQGMGSLQRRLRGCMAGVRAEPYAADAPEAVALELFLMQRAAGMAVETPAVRP